MKDISRGVGTLQHMLGFAVVCYAVVITANHNWYVGANNQNWLLSWSSFSVSSTFGTEWSHPESSHCHCWMTRFCKNEKWWKWWLFYHYLESESESGDYFISTLEVKVKVVSILPLPWKWKWKRWLFYQHLERLLPFLSTLLGASGPAGSQCFPVESVTHDGIDDGYPVVQWYPIE